MDTIMNKIILFFLPLFFLHSPLWAEENLTLRQCQQLALRNSPKLKPLEYKLLAQDGMIQQMGLSPNPEWEFEVENLFGTGEFQGLNALETTLGISQTIETAGKLNKRITVGKREKQIWQNEQKASALKVLFETTNAYINLLTWQERLALEKSFYQISQKTHEAIRISVETGKVSPMQETRAKVMLSSSRIRLDQAKRALQKAKIALSAQWGKETPAFNAVTGQLLPLPKIKPPKAYQDSIKKHPVLHQAKNIIQKQQALLHLEQANAIPNFQIGAGIRYMNDANDGSFILQFSIPLPLRDRNQGAIHAAHARIQQAEKEYTQQQFQFTAQLHQAYQDYSQATEETTILREEILPNAQSTYEAAEEGFRQGKFSYLSVLDAQRAFFESKIQLLHAAAKAHKAQNEFNRITSNFKILHNHAREINQ